MPVEVAHAAAFRAKGVPIDILIGFLDVHYSGHKRIHGLKTQGCVFPNGASCLPSNRPPRPASPQPHARNGDSQPVIVRHAPVLGS